MTRYKVSTGTSTVVKNFPDAIGRLDGSGQCMVLHLGDPARPRAS
jgi:hypothetical protein